MTHKNGFTSLLPHGRGSGGARRRGGKTLSLLQRGTAGWTEWNNDNPQNLTKRLCWRELAARVLEVVLPVPSWALSSSTPRGVAWRVGCEWWTAELAESHPRNPTNAVANPFLCKFEFQLVCRDNWKKNVVYNTDTAYLIQCENDFLQAVSKAFSIGHY